MDSNIRFISGDSFQKSSMRLLYRVYKDIRGKWNYGYHFGPIYPILSRDINNMPVRKKNA